MILLVLANIFLQAPKKYVKILSIMSDILNDEEKKEWKNYKRHINIWRLSRFLAPVYLKAKLGYTYDVAPKTFNPPYIVLSNHNSNFDAVGLGLSFPRHMYFIASEQVYRSGFKSKLLKWAFEPIAKIKGSTDFLAVAKALRKIRKGQNICLFPEANRSFNGKTYPIQEATGKLVKVSGGGLITYRFEGEYLSTPRWAKNGVRKGKVHGRIVHYYTAEELKEMSVSEVTDIIRQDLYEDAYARQAENPIKYKGKNRAEGMECAVCVCPECKKIDVIGTHKNTVFCKNCGVSTEYDEYGYFGDDFKFKTITQWDEWQTEFYKDYIANFSDETQPLFFDDNVKLSVIGNDHLETKIGSGCFKFFKDRIEFNETTILVKDITAVSIFGKCVLCFSDAKGLHYELRPENFTDIKNFRKYTSALEILLGLVG